MKVNPNFMRVLVLTLFGLTIANFAWANGEDFFVPPPAAAGTYQPLYYFGHVKDKSGKVLKDVVIDVSVSVDGGKIHFMGTIDSPGHYRTTDIGRVMAGMKLGQVEISAKKPGYRQISPTTTVAPKNGKAVEVDFVMVEDGSK